MIFLVIVLVWLIGIPIMYYAVIRWGKGSESDADFTMCLLWPLILPFAVCYASFEEIKKVARAHKEADREKKKLNSKK
jgi:hypothetical protein